MHVVERIVQFFGEHGTLVEPEAVAYVARQDDPDAFLHSLVSGTQEMPLFMTLPRLQELSTVFGPAPLSEPSPSMEAQEASARRVMAGIRQALEPPATVFDAPVAARDVDADVVVTKDASSLGRSHGQLQDFVRYFNDRLDTMSRLLRRRREVANPTPFDQIQQAGREVQLIGLVHEVSATPNGHVFVELEDRTGNAQVLAHANTPALVTEAKTLLSDEVVGVVATPSRDGTLLVAKQFVRPDIPYRSPPKERAPGVCAAFLSDIHVGSKTFLRKPFERMLAWLRGQDGNRRERDVARRVKYLVLSGDVVDGIGVFPGQEDSLEIPQIHRQYEELGHLLRQVPPHVHVVIQPGNHDAVRPTEPQPAFDKGLREPFEGIDATFVSNPSTFALHGVNVLSYHGYSMIDFATRVPGLAMDRPLDIMRLMLRARHLAPAYGATTPLSPEEKDFLVIDEVPDVFVTGHVHVNGIEQYRGVTMINAGTWQDQTDYQRVHNLVPTPARLPVMDLGSLNATQIDFSVA